LNECLVIVINELKEKRRMTGKNSLDMVPPTQLLRVAAARSEGEVRFQFGPMFEKREWVQ
jgi:hypothetical protein